MSDKKGNNDTKRGNDWRTVYAYFPEHEDDDLDPETAEALRLMREGKEPLSHTVQTAGEYD